VWVISDSLLLLLLLFPLNKGNNKITELPIHNPVMEPTTRGHSSSRGPGILQKGNPDSQILTPLTLFLIVHA
jgi:hypothetical protein